MLGRTALLIDGLHKKIDFEFTESIDGQPVDRDRLERRLMAGLEFAQDGPISGSFLIGYDTIDVNSPLLPDLDEIVVEADVAYKLTSRTRLRFTGERLPGFAVWGLNSYYLNTEYGLGVVHYLTRVYGIEFRGRLGTLTFPESEFSSDREDEIVRWDVGLRLRMYRDSTGKRVEYRLRVGHYRRESSIPFFDQSQTTFGIDALFGY